MINVAIIEDEISAQKNLKDNLDKFSKENDFEFNICFFDNGYAFLGAYNNQFDIIFLDIEMPGIDGMDVAKSIRKKDEKVALVFVTNLSQMAAEGYQVDALDFIIKPIKPASFNLKMKRIVSRSLSQVNTSILINDSNKETIVLNLKDIYYVETSGHYVIYHTTKGKIEEYGTLKQVEEKINHKKSFARCNRSYLVNLQYVEKIEKEFCIINGDRLIISRPTYKEFIKALAEYIGG